MRESSRQQTVHAALFRWFVGCVLKVSAIRNVHELTSDFLCKKVVQVSGPILQSWSRRPRFYDKTGLRPASVLVLVLVLTLWSCFHHCQIIEHVSSPASGLCLSFCYFCTCVDGCVQLNCGKMRWYKLKDKKLMTASQGSIQLELDFVFNHVWASL